MSHATVLPLSSVQRSPWTRMVTSPGVSWNSAVVSPSMFNESWILPDPPIGKTIGAPSCKPLTSKYVNVTSIEQTSSGTYPRLPGMAAMLAAARAANQGTAFLRNDAKDMA